MQFRVLLNCMKMCELNFYKVNPNNVHYLERIKQLSVVVLACKSTVKIVRNRCDGQNAEGDLFL